MGLDVTWDHPGPQIQDKKASILLFQNWGPPDYTDVLPLLLKFCLSRIPYKWNHTVHGPLGLASFTLLSGLDVHCFVFAEY